jgi:hypothetical protein
MTVRTAASDNPAVQPARGATAVNTDPSPRGLPDVVSPARDERSMRLLEVGVAVLAIAASLALALLR